MKFILLIPVLMLFIGQVPFLKQMEEKMKQVTVEEKMSCCKEEKTDEEVCHQPEKKNEDAGADACCKTEARCACVCCYSMAPVTERTADHKCFEDASAIAIITGNAALAFQYYPVLTPPPDVL